MAAIAAARRLAGHIEMAARNIEHGRRRGGIEITFDPHLVAAAIIGGLRSFLGVALDAGSSVRPA